MAVSIDAPVGLRNRTTNVANLSRDQERILHLLSQIAVMDGGKEEAWPARPLAGADGDCPGLLAAAIWDFQTHWKRKGVFQHIDGVVDPGGRTLEQMNHLISANHDSGPLLPID